MQTRSVLQKGAIADKSITIQTSYCRAASWSWISTVPSLWWTACRIFWPWNPLPRPSRRATMTPWTPTSTESQPREKRSLTAWPPGALSLFSPVENTHLIYAVTLCLTFENNEYAKKEISYMINKRGWACVSSKSNGVINPRRSPGEEYKREISLLFPSWKGTPWVSMERTCLEQCGTKAVDLNRPSFPLGDRPV